MHAERSKLPILRIHEADVWWADPAFRAWTCHPGTAKWSLGNRGIAPRDIFTYYTDPFSGSDFEGDPSVDHDDRSMIPSYIWREITKMVEQTFGNEATECLVWISFTS